MLRGSAAIGKRHKINQRIEERPLRTRDHYIEALSRNHFEKQILLRGHIVDEPSSDYGYDIVMQTFDYKGNPRFERGEFENGQIFFQLKATDKLNILADGVTISFEIYRRHAILWEKEPSPVYLIVYSVEDEICYWLHMQPYLKSKDFVMPAGTQAKVTVHLSKASVVNAQAVDSFRAEKQRMLDKVEGAHLYD